MIAFSGTAATRRFDRAAADYDDLASVQKQIADALTAWAAKTCPAPLDVLDLGCGTGFVAEAVHKIWPSTQVTAVDASAAMLENARRKIPNARFIQADAAALDIEQKFDLVFSSMMLHWLPDPREALRRWRAFLKPDGRMYVALLTDGSFQEWRDLCRTENPTDGLWDFPRIDFANDFAAESKRQSIIINYASAHDFLKRLKLIGATTPRPEHRPFSAATMRRLMTQAPRPFPVTYQVLYLTMQFLGKV